MQTYYTEEQLKRAFENGVYAGMHFANEGEVALRAELTEPGSAVYRSNVTSFLWSEIVWDQVRDWILEKPVSNEVLR